jgi:2-C-methyl-D-erythritol 4-phosphate cytidylyltransferase
MNYYALIVAGGSGNRMGTEIPKQFLLLEGKPILMYSIERFWKFDKSINIIVVLPEQYLKYWEDLKKEFSFSVKHTIVKGGITRYQSVKNGLLNIEDDSLVAIHDGVRPLVSTHTIQRCFEGAEKYGNAIPVINPADSVRMITEQGNMPLNRLFVRFIQTPQVFRTNLIRKAYFQDFHPDFTDDAILLEKTGEVIHLVEGNRENIKITNPEDLLVAGALLDSVS